MKKYTVIKRFRDRSDDLKTYVEGEEYPHAGTPAPTIKRREFLQSHGYIEAREEPINDGEKL